MNVEQRRARFQTEPGGRQDAASEAFSPRKASKLFFLSFEHSQGNTALQKHIFDYLAYLRPEWTMDEHFKAHVFGDISPAILKFALPQAGKTQLHTDDTEIGCLDSGGVIEEIKEQLRSMQQSLNRMPGDAPNLLTLAAAMINRDRLYLEKGRPRQGVQQRARYSPKGDPWLSHFVYYGLERRATGAPEYDRMYADVVDAVTSSLAQDPPPEAFCRNMYGELREVIALNRAKHPDHPMPEMCAALLRSLAAWRG